MWERVPRNAAGEGAVTDRVNTSPLKKAALRFRGRFHNVKQRGREIPPAAPGFEGTLLPKPGRHIHPVEITVMIRTLSGIDK